MKALILGVGGLRGAYDAGVATALCRKLGSKYFDAIYMSSVGSFAGTFYAANQPDTIENTWRNYVDGNQLVDYKNLLKKKNVLNTDYLIKIFQNEKSFLRINEVFNSGVKLTYVVENMKTGLPEYKSPTKENLLQLLLAASAVPVLHSPIKLDNEMFVDGSLVDSAPIERAIEDGYEEIVFIYNKQKGYEINKAFKLLVSVLATFVPQPIKSQARNMSNLYKEIEAKLENNRNIFTIRPDKRLNSHMLSRKKNEINNLFDQGLKDGYEAAESILDPSKI